MKDKKGYAFSAFALTALLAGCSTNNMTASTTPKETAAANKVTITAQGFKPDQKEKNDQLDQRINRFKAKFPNVDFKKTTGSIIRLKSG